MDEAIDYGAHAATPATGGSIDYGAHSSEAPDKSLGEHVIDAVKSFWDTVNPAKLAVGLNETLKQNPADTAKSYGAQNSQILQNAKDAWQRGDHASAIAHGVNYLLNGVPGVGATLDEAQQDAEKGNTGTALGRTAGLAALAIVPPKVPGAASAAMDAAKTVATNPKVLRAAGAAAGAGTGEYIGHALGIPGVGAMAGGYAGRELGSALAEAVNAKDPAPPGGPTEAQQLQAARIAESRTVPPYKVMPIDRPAPAAFKPTAPASLPSGRVPGRPAFDAQTGEMLTGVGNGEYSNTIPEVPKIAVNPASRPISPAATQQSSAAPSPSVNGRPVVLQEDGKPLMYTDGAPPAAKPLSPAEEFAKAIMGKTEGGTIPFNSPHPPAAAFEDAYQGKRAQVIANQLFQHGIPYQDAAKINPESMAPKDWETLLGKDPETGVQYHAPSQETLDQARVLLLHKYAASRTPAAASAAKALAEEMTK